MNDAMLRRLLLSWLANEGGGDQTPSAARAVAAGRLLKRMVERLSVVIGSLGVRALFLRALAISRREYGFLDGEDLVPLERGDDMGAPLRACLEVQAPDVVTQATLALFTTVVDLLVSAIGNRLAWNLLRDVWPDALRPEIEPQENEE
jgi:hypothetical protein